MHGCAGWLSPQQQSTLLLYGLQGTGKSLLSSALAAETGAAFFDISPSVTDGKWPGKAVSAMLATVRLPALAPTLAARTLAWQAAACGHRGGTLHPALPGNDSQLQALLAWERGQGAHDRQPPGGLLTRSQRAGVQAGPGSWRPPSSTSMTWTRYAACSEPSAHERRCRSPPPPSTCQQAGEGSSPAGQCTRRCSWQTRSVPSCWAAWSRSTASRRTSSNWYTRRCCSARRHTHAPLADSVLCCVLQHQLEGHPSKAARPRLRQAAVRPADEGPHA